MATPLHMPAPDGGALCRVAPPRGAWWLLLLALTLATSACRPSPVQAPGVTSMRIVEVTFEGVENVDERDLADALATRRDRYNPFEPPRMFNRFAVQQDIQRIQAFYHARGYFNARVVDWTVEPTPDPDQDQRRARVHFVIDEGEPTFLDSVRYGDREIRGIDRRRLLADLPIREGTVLNVDDAERARQEMRRRLQENSYAYARVDMRIYVDREARLAQLFYFIDPGPASQFGNIEVRGNRRLPDEAIRNRIRIRPGNVYRHSLLRTAQLDLYDMNVFSLVTVESMADREQRRAIRFDGARPPAAWQGRDQTLRAHAERVHEQASESGLSLAWDVVDGIRHGAGDLARLDLFDDVAIIDPNVDILITVSELPSANYRFGGGIGIEAGRTEVFGRANAVWRNVLSPLNRIEADGRLGHAWLPSLWQSEETGIVGSAQVSYARPGAFFRLADVNLRLRYEEDIEPGYRYASPRARVGLSRRLTRDLTLSLGYNVDLFFIRDDELRGADSESLLPREFSLAYFDLMLQLDRRDNPLSARRGDYSELSIELGETFALGEYHYLRIQPEFRHYQPVGRRLVLASRLRVGTIFNIGDQPVIRTQRFFAGGSDTVRGFRRRQISPYEFALDDGTITRDAACLGAEESCRRVPIGGFSVAVANIEPRYMIGRDWLAGAIFLDGGFVGDETLAWRLQPGADGLQLGTGFGLRLITPIGPIRTDFAWRLTDDPAFAGIRRFGFYLSIGEAF